MSGAAEVIDRLTSYSELGLQWRVAKVIEYGEVDVPEDLLLVGSRIDLYDEVLSKALFRLGTRGKNLVLQAGSFVGLIPLNDRLAIEVNTRVPVANLERMLAVGSEYRQLTLPFMSAYVEADDAPQSIVDVIADNLLAAVEGLRQEGMYKEYRNQLRTGTDIAGRVFPLETMIQRQQTGRATAVFSRFVRTQDNLVNSCIRTALGLLHELYVSLKDRKGRRARLSRLAQALALFEGVSSNAASSFRRDARIYNPWNLPENRPFLGRAVVTAMLVNENWGVSIRQRGPSKLPAMAINMEDVFEAYVRNTLAFAFEGVAECRVLNGALDRPAGAKGKIFNADSIGKHGNAVASPDTVVEIGGKPRLIIETKYKPPKGMPIRDELDQVIAYGCAYGCKNVVLAYPSTQGLGETILLGHVAGLAVWMTTISLGASEPELVERAFTKRMFELASMED